MTSATLNIKVQPRRMLNAHEAAGYCGVSIKRFPIVCRVRPIALPDGQHLYDIQDLDRWIEDLKDDRIADDEAVLAKLA